MLIHYVQKLVLGLLLAGQSFLAAGATVEAAFSPGEAPVLVLRQIQEAQSSIFVAAYSFTSPEVAAALVKAYRRGVAVKVVLDDSQRGERYTSATYLANAGIPVRIDSAHAIQHNKYMVIDRAHVQTGSFNYTRSAAERNAENVLVVRESPALAAQYLADWAAHWAHSAPYAAKLGSP